MARPVSQILLEDYSLTIRPGARGECPFCHLKYFSLKGDDTLGKCFHPPCGHFITADTGQTAARRGLVEVLTTVAQDCHTELLVLASGSHNAYTYLSEERGIHPQVIQHARLGAVPSGYDVAPLFAPVLADAQAALTATQHPPVGRPSPKAQAQAQERLTWLQTQQQTLVACLAGRAGWLVFVYDDAAHRPVALRLRAPYTRQFVSFKPWHAGLFGRELFPPYAHPSHHAMNDFLLVVEGEFNALQLQSLTLRYEHATGQTLGYVNICAVGGVLTADVEAIKRVAQHPVVVYDHDRHQAGFELVKRLQSVMPLEACTTPLVVGDKSDLDSFIKGFDQDDVGAWEGVKALVAGREPYGRVYSGTGAEFFRPTSTGQGKQFVPRWLGEALTSRDIYAYAASLLWVYRDGVYTACGETHLRTDAQGLLGDERQERYLQEAQRWVEVDTYRDVTEKPDPTYINLQNGRLDWVERKLEPHTPEVFTTIQLPLAYDEDAKCPIFDAYLASTFDEELWPVIEELLGWCVQPENPYERAVMLTGAGKNGKGTLLGLLGDFLGEANVSHVALQDLADHPFRVAELYGKLANLFADLDPRRLQSSSMFKMLVTGDPITAERKYGQPFKFRNFAKLLFSANDLPVSTDRTYAYYRRWLMIPFSRTFNGEGGNPAADVDLREKLRGELPGIFNKALLGLERLILQGDFTPTTATAEQMKRYIQSNENPRVFAQECLLHQVNGLVLKQELYAVYKRWCDDNAERAFGQKYFKETLQKVYSDLAECRPNGGIEPWHWKNITWSPDGDAYRQ